MPTAASPIFVIGCTRSGKSLVAAILNKHPELHITFESQIYSSLYRKWSYARKNLGTDPQRSFKEIFLPRISDQSITESEFDNCIECSDSTWEDMYDRYMQLVISKVKPAATRWGDKTPVDAGTSKIILSHYPKAQFVYLYRDPRDTVSSMSLPDYTPCVNNHLINADVYDQYLQEYSKEIYQPDLNILRMRYEKLVENPAAGVEEICQFLGVNFQPHLLKPADQAVRKPIGWENFNVWDEIKVQPVKKSPLDPFVSSYLARWIDNMGYDQKSVRFRGLRRLGVALYLVPFKTTRILLKRFFKLKYPEFPYICYRYPKFSNLARWTGLSGKKSPEK